MGRSASTKPASQSNVAAYAAALKIKLTGRTVDAPQYVTIKKPCGNALALEFQLSVFSAGRHIVGNHLVKFYLVISVLPADKPHEVAAGRHEAIAVKSAVYECDFLASPVCLQ